MRNDEESQGGDTVVLEEGRKTIMTRSWTSGEETDITADRLDSEPSAGEMGGGGRDVGVTDLYHEAHRLELGETRLAARSWQRPN
jgi:hypothetical protein